MTPKRLLSLLLLGVMGNKERRRKLAAFAVFEVIMEPIKGMKAAVTTRAYRLHTTVDTVVIDMVFETPMRVPS